MSEAAGLVVLGLAIARISWLLARENGPYDFLARLRYALGVRYDKISQPYGTNMLSKMIICYYCNSVWLGVGLSLAYYLARDLTVWLCLPFALSQAAVFLNNRS